MATAKREGGEAVFTLTEDEARDLASFVKEGGSYWIRRAQDETRSPGAAKFLRKMAGRAFAWANFILTTKSDEVSFTPEIDECGD